MCQWSIGISKLMCYFIELVWEGQNNYGDVKQMGNKFWGVLYLYIFTYSGTHQPPGLLQVKQDKQLSSVINTHSISIALGAKIK